MEVNIEERVNKILKLIDYNITSEPSIIISLIFIIVNTEHNEGFSFFVCSDENVNRLCEVANAKEKWFWDFVLPKILYYKIMSYDGGENEYVLTWRINESSL